MLSNSDPTVLVDIFQKGFIIAVTVTLISIALAIFLFFKLDIRMVFIRRSGKARRKAVKAVEAKASETGRLVAEGLLEVETAEQPEKTEQTGGKTGRTAKTKKGHTGSTRKTGQTAVSGEMLPLAGGEKGETAPIGSRMPDSVNRVTENFDYPAFGVVEAAARLSVVVTERIVVIHTNEWIEI